MQVAIQINSATEAEMRRGLLAWHLTAERYPAPKLVLDGLVTRVEGPHCYKVESPRIEPARAAEIIAAMADESKIALLTERRDSAILLRRGLAA